MEFVNGYCVSKSYSPECGYYVTVAYVKPGGAISRPEWEKCAFVRGAGADRLVSAYFSSVVEHIARMDIPAGGYAVISA